MASQGGIRAGRAFIELGVNDKLTAGLKKAQRQLEGFSAGVKAIGGGISHVGSAITSTGAKIFAAGAAAVTGFGGAAKVFADAGSALNDMSQRTGVSVEQLSELSYAAKLSGADLESLEGGLRKMQKNLQAGAEGSQEAAQSFGELGLSISGLKSLAPDEQLRKVATAIDSIKDPTEKASAAMKIFGKSGTGLLPLFEGGGKGIEAMQKQARALGLTMSTETAKSADLLGDTLDSMFAVIRQTAVVIGGALAPTLTAMSSKVAKVLAAFNKWIGQNRELVVSAAKVAAGVAATGAALIVAGIGVNYLGKAFSGIGSIAGLAAKTLGLIAPILGTLLSPMGLVVAAAAAMGGAIFYYSGYGGQALTWLKDRFAELSDFVGKVATGIGDALAAGDIQLAGNILWTGLKVAWQTGVIELNKVWNDWRKAFLTVVYEAWTGALVLIENLWDGMKTVWIETTTFIENGWIKLTAGISSAWEEASHFVIEQWETIKNIAAKVWHYIKGLFDEGFDVTAANEAADIALVNALKGIDATKAANLKRIMDEKNATLQAIADEKTAREATEATSHEGRLKQIIAEENARLAGIDTGNAEALAAANTELTNLKTQLTELRNKAATERAEAVKAEAQGVQGIPGKRPGVAEAVDGFVKKNSVAGTFSGLAVGQLGGGGGVASAIESLAKRHAEASRWQEKMFHLLQERMKPAMWQ